MHGPGGRGSAEGRRHFNDNDKPRRGKLTSLDEEEGGEVEDVGGLGVMEYTPPGEGDFPNDDEYDARGSEPRHTHEHKHHHYHNPHPSLRGGGEAGGALLSRILYILRLVYLGPIQILARGYRRKGRGLVFVGILFVVAVIAGLGWLGVGEGRGRWFSMGWREVEVSVEAGIGEGEKWREFLKVEGWEGAVVVTGKEGEGNGGAEVVDPYSRRRRKMAGGGEYVECDYHDYDAGSGVVRRRRKRPDVRRFKKVPEGLPEPVFGGYGVIGLEEEGGCFEKRGRLGGYGLGYGEAEGGLGGNGTEEERMVDWRGVDWGEVQRRCVERNIVRFGGSGGKIVGSEEEESPIWGRDEEGKGGEAVRVKRSAVLMRTWDDYKYTDNDILNLRSLISELAVNTGGEYQVHLLVHVKDPNIPIWSDSQTYQTHLENSVPREFWGISTLWNEPLMRLVYNSLPENDFRDLPLHGVYRSSFMPVQWFANRHPEYEFFWNWEMDVRFTGHWYELFETVGEWARGQKRRYLWERNDRFYIPTVHGAYQEFERRVEREVTINETIWGPVEVPGVVLDPEDPTPPATAPTAFHEALQFSGEDGGQGVRTPWGVGEDADLIVFNPLFDANNTDWLLALDTTGYTTPPPRRSAIIASSRLSRRLLQRMHNENAHHGHAAFTEMWPATCALHHGMKAVYVPHPVYMDRKWPSWYLEKTFNHGVAGSTGGRRESVFGPREHNFQGTTWYYNAAFGRELYGLWVNGAEEGGREGMCVRGMLVHPVKEVPDLVG